MGLHVFNGSQDGLNVTYVYKIKGVGINYYKCIDSGGKWRWQYVVSPHYIKSDFLRSPVSSSVEEAHEWGIGLGIKGLVYIQDENIYAWSKVMTGPHHLSDAPDRQIPGFMFSSQFLMGLGLKLKGDVSVEAYAGFRHVSNGEIRMPNGGINNLYYGLGLVLNQ